MATKAKVPPRGVAELRQALKEVEERLDRAAPGAESYAWGYGYLSSAVRSLLKEHPEPTS